MSRIIQFVPDGVRVRVSPGDVAMLWQRMALPALTVAGPLTIPPQYACGTAQHETDYTINEVDTEPSGFVSKGIFQLSDEEAQEAGDPTANMLTLPGAISVLLPIAQKRVQKLVAAAQAVQGDSLANAMNGDLWAYLALAHNQGLGAALKTIGMHGLDWRAYKDRNPHLADMAAYGDDCISGGARWGEVQLVA